MLLTAFLSLNLLGRLPKLPAPGPLTRPEAHRQHIGPWRVVAAKDRFSGSINCVVSARGVQLRNDTLVFRLAHDEDTTHAIYRLDWGKPRPVSDAFAELESRGVFPQRGWIFDPNGGEVALPAHYVAGAETIALRRSPKAGPDDYRVYRVAKLNEAAAAAKAAGCGLDAN